MKRAFLVGIGIALLLLVAGVAWAVVAPAAVRPVPETAAAQAIRFAPLDVVIDSQDKALGAYQFELAVEKGHAVIVGIEGGEDGAFHSAPYYDPAALQNGRIIIAAFSMDANLPKGKTRVARLHMRITGDGMPEYATKLMVATGPDGKDVAAQASVSASTPQ